MNKIIVIGLDGADFRYIDPLLRNQQLPNIKRIIERGFAAEFNSSEIPYTSQAWATIITGRDAGGHGIYDTVLIDKDYKKFVSHSKGLSAACFWQYLSEKNVKSLIVNVPMVYPVRACENAHIISGFDAPVDGSRFCCPQDYLDKLRHKGVIYDWHKKQNELCKLNDLEKRFKQSMNGIWQQYDAVLKISRLEDWDCLFTVFQFTDWIVHRTNRTELIENTYIELDKVIGKFLEDYPDINIFILSDHGICAAQHRVSINKLLFDLGLLKFKPKAVSYQQIEAGIEKVFHSKTLAWGASRFYKILPEKVKLVTTKFLAKKYPQLLLKRDTVDFANSRVFFTGLGSIYINSKSRFTAGLVNPEETKAITEKIKQAFQGLKDENGEEIIECFDPSEVWHFDNAPNDYVIPDMVIRSKLAGYYITDVGFSGNLLEAVEKEMGVHWKTGIFLAAGPQIPSFGYRLTSNLVGFVPSLFETLGLSTPTFCLGKSLIGNGLGKEKYLHEDLREGSDSILTKEETQEVREKLKNLGYI